MMELWIDDVKADLTDDALVLFTYSVADAQEPTVVKNSYSQTVKLPRTAQNEAIFSHYSRQDFRVSSGYSPIVRTPFVIRNELGAILERGYLKLDSVDAQYYNVTLYGGLGDYFYQLTYNEDGTKKTLADLKWWCDNDWQDLNDMIVRVNKATIRYNWENLNTNRHGDSFFFSWAPAYNGYPDDFDADKAYYNPSEASSASPGYVDVVTSKDGYGPKNNNGGVIVQLPSEQTEWEMQELRADQQRPVWKVQSFFYALTHCSDNKFGFDVEVIQEGFFDPGNSYLADLWVTLPVSNNSMRTMANFFDGTLSPGEYLLAFAKLFGLMFIYDHAANKVTICCRNNYYGDGTLTKIDISDSIARDKAMTITPLAIEDRWQSLSLETIGENAAAYEGKYNVAYGSKRVDTGFPYNNDDNDIMKDVPFNVAPDVLERSTSFQVYDTGPGTERYHIKQRAQGKVSWLLYKTENSATSTLEVEPTTSFIITNVHGYASGFKDFFPKVQLHDADNKAIDGSNVLLLYREDVSTPEGTSTGREWKANFYLTGSNSDMLIINDNVPCWDITCRPADLITALPSFRRFGEIAGDDYCLEFDAPKEVYTTDAPLSAGCVYYRCWKRWIEERSNKDIRKVTCYVDLRHLKTGSQYLQVGPELLRYFYTFDNALWSLEEIADYSLNSDDLTKCTFVKVIDIDAYNGQVY